MKKIFKRSIAILICLTMIFNCFFATLANQNLENIELESTYTESIKNIESNEEEIEERTSIEETTTEDDIAIEEDSEEDNNNEEISNIEELEELNEESEENEEGSSDEELENDAPISNVSYEDLEDETYEEEPEEEALDDTFEESEGIEELKEIEESEEMEESLNDNEDIDDAKPEVELENNSIEVNDKEENEDYDNEVEKNTTSNIEELISDVDSKGTEEPNQIKEDEEIKVEINNETDGEKKYETEEIKNTSPSEINEEVEECLEEKIIDNTILKSDVNEIIDEMESATPSEIVNITTEYFIREKVVDNIKITLTADYGVFPEDAILWAEKVEDANTEEAIEEAVEKERENDVNVAASYKFDIKMFVNGEEVQPDTTRGSVKVIFTLAEELSKCLDANVYHLKEEADGGLTAENLGAEVKTVEEADEEETAKEAGDASETGNTVSFDEDGVLEDGIIENDVTKRVTKLEADTDSFSYYVVEFTYNELQYLLPFPGSVKLSEILNTFAIKGTVSMARVISSTDIFILTKDEGSDDWTITASKTFSTKELMQVTMVDGQVYEIALKYVTDPVSYLIWDDENKELFERFCTEYTVIDTSTVEPDGGYTFENGKWYVVIEDVTFNKRIENSAVNNTPAHLILTDGHTLNANGGIHNVNGHCLVIYGQAEGTGCLNIPGASDDCAGIGGNKREDGGGLIVNGGTVSVTGADEGAGIGGGSERSFDYFIINGGTVNAIGGYQGGAGIGGGKWGTGGNVTVNGGTVNAYGCEWAAGIGGGHAGPGGNVTINGGKIFAQGNSTCAIGNGYNRVHRPYPGEVYFGDIKPSKVTGSGYLLDAEILSAKHSDYNPVEVEYKKVNYTVKHWKQKEVFKDDYELIDTEILTWFANNDTKAAAKEIPDYSASFTQAKIEEDGTTVIDIRYNVIYYTISFDMKGHGEPVQAISAVPGTLVSEPASPSEKGYVFEGWYTDADCKNKYQFTTMPSYNLILYAKWTAGPFERQDVPYVDENGNTATASCIIMPDNQKNYAFTDGEWYAVTLDAVIENRIDTQASHENPAHLVLTDGHSLTANKGIECGAGKGLVIYGQSNGTGKLTATVGDIAYSGIGSDGDIIINGGTVIAVGGRRYWPTSMSWAGYAGIGGYVTINGGTVTATGGEPEGSGIGYGNDGSHIGTVTINGGIVTATGAKNAPGIGCGTGGGNVLTITINGGTVTATGGTGADGIGPGLRGKADITVNGGEITATGATGKAGIGGNLSFGRIPSELKGGADKNSAENVDIDTYKENRDKYPYAYLRYAKAEYQVKHMLQKEICGDEYELKDTETLSGYVNSMTEATARDIYSGYKSLLPIEQKTITAEGTVVEIRYNLIYHTVTFNANGHGTALESIKVLPGTTIAAPQDPFAEGYVFGGWFTDSACTKLYDFITPVTSDLTLYAKWTKRIYKKYTITWMLNDIKLIDTTEVLEGEMPVHKNPEREGYIFVGWKPALVPVIGNAKYTAYFKERETNKIAVTFNTNGGTFIDTQIIDRDTTPERPADPQKKGCEFEGWYREAGFITPYDFDEPVNTDMMLHAKWKTVTRYYEITWQDWDKKKLAITISEEGKLPKYPGTSNPSRSGYIFTGWTPKINLAASNMTYTATYKKKSSGGGGDGGGDTGITPKISYDPLKTQAKLGILRLQDLVINIDNYEWIYNPMDSTWSLNIDKKGLVASELNKTYDKNNKPLAKNCFCNIDGSIYYFDENEKMITGWLKNELGEMYLFEWKKNTNEGKMVKGWKLVNNNWYYFREDGRLLTYSFTPDGYFVDADGIYVENSEDIRNIDTNTINVINDVIKKNGPNIK